MKKLINWPMLLVAGLCFTPVPSLPAAGKTLVFCSEGSPERFNPQYASTGVTQDATSVPMFNRLVEYELGSFDFRPGLAKSWDVSPDGLRYTFRLREGVKFHSTARFRPSRDFNADDVVFSYQRMADANHPFHGISPGAVYSFFDDMAMNKIVDKLEKLDAMTVRFTLKHAEAPFLGKLAMDFSSIHSAEYADRMKAAGTPEIVDRELVGTGPFQFVSYQKDAIVRYKAFDGYWGARPKIDNLVFAITPDASVRYAKLRAGECHVMSLPKPADLPAMKADPNLTVLSKPGLNVGYIAFNVEKKPYDNKLLRQALAMAVDKPAILKIVFQGTGQAAKNPIPPSMWSYNDAIQDYVFDPAAAKVLLAKAGAPNGIDLTLWYLPISRPHNPDGKRMAELLQADWAKIGVRTTLQTYEWSEYNKRSKAGQHSVVMYGWSGDGDPDDFFGPLLSCDGVASGGNLSRWCDKEFDGLIHQARAASTTAARTKMYMRAQEIVHEQSPLIEIAHSTRSTPMRKEVTGFKMDATGNNHFETVDLAK